MPDVYYDIQVKEKYNNQFTSINRISTGCKKILYILSLTIAAEINNISLITFEELENSIHTSLLQNLLLIISQLAGDTKVVITSHSPHLINYMQPGKIKLGMTTSNGIANFRSIKKSKIKKILRNASSEESSLGEYLFDMMLNAEEDEELLKEYFI
ncbi:MAG: ATP-binding protein [Spirochaetaceae bacterium]|nr:ATP-binding protein [Spirochaetaceae bacterium]